MLYRIYTEDKPNVASLSRQYFDDFTLIKGKGYWHGIAEDSTIIEIVTENKPHIYELSEAIKQVNKQECVLVIELATYTEVFI